jgi:hypothetical protein
MTANNSSNHSLDIAESEANLALCLLNKSGKEGNYISAVAHYTAAITLLNNAAKRIKKERAGLIRTMARLEGGAQ